MSERTPILVTGAHRSGTTWVGKMLAANPRVAYLSEPLNVWHRPGVLGAPVEKWYTYLCAENEAAYLPAFRDTLAFRYGLWREVRALRSRKDVLRMGRDAAIFLRGRLFRQRPLLKDPFAVFSMPWFAARLGCRVVVTVRHPAAFASSLKRLNWPFDFRDLLGQPLLMRDWLEEDRAAMEAMPADDLIGQAALLWRMIYRVVARTRDLLPPLIIVRHEDLSRDPLPGYRALYHSLGLDFTPQVERTILNASSAENPKELPQKQVHAVKLDSRANLDNWKKRLSADEIERVRQVCGEVAALFYSDSEW
ncbi:MAG: hypothetical protein Fur0043_01640 [Anaerolineales bacterium]